MENGPPARWSAAERHAEGVGRRPETRLAGESIAPGIQPSHGCVMCFLFAAWSGSRNERLTPHPLRGFRATPSPRYRAPSPQGKRRSRHAPAPRINDSQLTVWSSAMASTSRTNASGSRSSFCMISRTRSLQPAIQKTRSCGNWSVPRPFRSKLKTRGCTL